MAVVPWLPAHAIAETQAQNEVEAGAPRPALAVVLVGNATPEARAAATEVHTLLSPHFRVPVDATVVSALTGAQGDEADGLAALRSLRRSLGLSESADVEPLKRVARFLGVSSLVLLRAPAGAFELIVFSATEGSYFEDSLPWPSPEAKARRFVGSRAVAARNAPQPAQAPDRAPPGEPAPGSGGPGTDTAAIEASSGSTNGDSPISPATVASAANESQSGTEDLTQEPNFFEKNWPFMVAGALLAGVLAWFLLSRSSDDPAPPVLRFVPGE